MKEAVIVETRTNKKIGMNKVTILDEGIGLKPRVVVYSGNQSVMFLAGEVVELMDFLLKHYPLLRGAIE